MEPLAVTIGISFLCGRVQSLASAENAQAEASPRPSSTGPSRQTPGMHTEALSGE